MYSQKLVLVRNGLFNIMQDEVLAKKSKDYIKVQPVRVGICSSDIPRAFLNKSYYHPIVLGHEFCVSVFGHSFFVLTNLI